MLKLIFIFSFALQSLKTCSPAPNWVPSTLQEQIDKAGVIVSGYVQNLQNNGFKTTVTLQSAIYYRGCIAGGTVTIAGFHSTASCGPGVPQVGDHIIVFACADTTGSAQLEINDFTLHTGYVQYTNSNIQTVKNITGSQGMGCRTSSPIQKCKKRTVIQIDPWITSKIQKPFIRIPPRFPVPPRPDWTIKKPQWQFNSNLY